MSGDFFSFSLASAGHVYLLIEYLRSMEKGEKPVKALPRLRGYIRLVIHIAVTEAMDVQELFLNAGNIS